MTPTPDAPRKDTSQPNKAGDQPQLFSKSTVAFSPLQMPEVKLPQGGGSIQGVEEKFSVNPTTGSASFSIPLPTAPGRQGFAPSLKLSYDSGMGQSPFGLGWSLSLPSISRKTQKGLPLYNEYSEQNPALQDTFQFSGIEYKAQTPLPPSMCPVKCSPLTSFLKPFLTMANYSGRSPKFIRSEIILNEFFLCNTFANF
jgi:hypothetical protein